MFEAVHQGDILRVERIKHSVLVVSKDFFNLSGGIIGCPIYDNSLENPLHILIQTGQARKYVQCEKLTLLDLSVRGYKKIGQVSLGERINIADAVQGIFDYV